MYSLIYYSIIHMCTYCIIISTLVINKPWFWTLLT